MPDWIYCPSIKPDDYYGFVYLITNLTTGRMYVGRKYLTRAARKGKGRKTTARRPSEWQTYWGSCKSLNADIASLGHGSFKREIIRWCSTEAETNYAEIAEQFTRDVLKATLPDGSRAYYNANIMSRWFASSDESTRNKIAAAKRIWHENNKRPAPTRGQRAITDGESTRFLPAGDPMPDGWRFGRKARVYATPAKDAYEAAPRSCAICGTLLSFAQRNWSTCSHACQGRANAGYDSPKAISREVISLIRADLAAGTKNRVIARRYGLHENTISKIKNNHIYTD